MPVSIWRFEADQAPAMDAVMLDSRYPSSQTRHRSKSNGLTTTGSNSVMEAL
jgi:hypothetical protein